MQRKIGKTDVSVFVIGLGAMPLSLADRPSREDAIKVIHAALDNGVDFIDTANVYCIDDSDIGHNEILITEAIRSWPKRKNIYVATKGGLCRPKGTWQTDGHPKRLRDACEKSLCDCDVDQIFLYQLHAPENSVPFSDQIDALRRLQEEGKIKHIGISNVEAQQIDDAQKIARIETVQNRWNPVCTRDAFNGVFDACIRHEMTYIAYSPVGGGFSHAGLADHELLRDLAHRYSVTPYQIMLAWALAKGGHVLPIPGASRIASIVDSVKAVSVVLTVNDMQAIDEIGAQ